MALLSDILDPLIKIEDSINDFFSEEIANGEKINFKNIIFDNKEDAFEYIDALSAVMKEEIIVARIKTPLAVFSETDEYTDLKKNIIHYSDLIKGTPKVLLQKLSEQTSSKKGCKKCKSSISKEYFVSKLHKIEETKPLDFADVSCPVCLDAHFLLSGTEQKQLDRWKEKLEQCNDKLKIAEHNFLLKTDNFGISFVYKKPLKSTQNIDE